MADKRVVTHKCLACTRSYYDNDLSGTRKVFGPGAHLYPTGYECTCRMGAVRTIEDARQEYERREAILNAQRAAWDRKDTDKNG